MQSLESNETKTVWKKKKFSQEKIPKKKAKKSFIRTENIEPLQNLYDLILSEENQEEREPDEKKERELPFPNSSNSDHDHHHDHDVSGNPVSDTNWWKCSAKPIDPEPSPDVFPENTESEETEKEGFSSKKRKSFLSTLSKVSNSVYDGIFSFNKVMDKFINQYSSEFVKTFSKKSDRKSDMQNDKGIVADVIKSMIACPLVVYIAYNWYYLLCYGPSSRVSPDTRLANDEKRVNLIDAFQLFNFEDADHKLVLRFLFGYFIFVYQITDFLFLGNYSLSFLLNIDIGKIFIFIIVIALTFYFVSKFNFYKSLQNAITGKQDILFYYCLILIIAWFVIRGITFAYYIIQLVWRTKIANLFTLFLIFVIYCGYLVITIIFGFYSITICRIIVIIYLWVNSLFGMMIYNGLYGEKEGGFFERINPFTVIGSINQFIEKDMGRWNDDYTDCHTPNLVKRLLRFLGHFSYTNIFSLCFLFTAMVSSYHVSRKIRSTSVKSVVFCLLGVLLAVLCLNIWSGSQAIWEKLAKQQNGQVGCNGEPVGGTSNVQPPVVSNITNIQNPLAGGTSIDQTADLASQE